MMDALEAWLAPFWIGVLVHLWQTAVFMAVLGTVALALRRSSARVLSTLYWVGVLKLLLPLPIFGPLSNRWLGSMADAVAMAPAAEAGWTTVTVLMYPLLLDLGPSGWMGLPPVTYVAATWVWLLGTGWLLVRRMRSGASRRRFALRRGSECSSDPPQKLRGAIAEAGLRPEDVRISVDSPGPFVRGPLRPVVVLPAAIVDGLDRDELRAVLVHEREHLRRRDPLRYAVLTWVRTLFWFYPPVWWLARRIRETAEMACDEAVVVEGLPAATYCRSLARTLNLGLAQGRAVSPVGVLGHRRSFLRRRLERIRSGRRFEAMFSHRLIVTAVALAALVVSILPIAPIEAFRAHAGEPTDAKELGQLEAADLPMRLSFQQAPLEKVLQAISETSGVRFRVAGAIEGKTVDVHTSDKTPLIKILAQIGNQAGLRYRVLGPQELEVYPILALDREGVTAPVLIPESKVNPVYPEAARKEGIQGTVILQALVDRTGAVSEVETVACEPKDSPQFIESAIAAIRQWRYEPATLDGKPVDVYFTVKIRFALEQGAKDL